MRTRVLLSAIFLLLSASAAVAQSGGGPQSAQPQTKNPDRVHRDEKDESNFPAEVLKKMEIARMESAHKKVLEDVDKLSELADEIARSYGERKKFSAEDAKKLGSIEKFAKRVLASAGGEETDLKPDAGGQITIADAIDKLTAAASSIKKEMRAETRFVVSATVIANSNEVIGLARFLRHNQKAN